MEVDQLKIMTDYFRIVIVTTFLLLSFIVSNERQFLIEKQMYCPCKKGVLYDHDSRSADQLKQLISVLIRNPVNSEDIQSVILKDFKSSERLSNCLAAEYKNYQSKNYLQDHEIFKIISECYGEDLIRNEDSTILYLVVFIILAIGFCLAYFFIKRPKVF